MSSMKSHNPAELAPPVEASPLLTLADIVRIAADYDADAKLLSELPERVERKRQLLEAAMRFAPPGFDPRARGVEPAPDTAPPPVSRTPEEFSLVAPQSSPSLAARRRLTRRGAPTWVTEVERILNLQTAPMSNQALLLALKEQSPLGPTSSLGDKGFYKAVSTLTKRGVLIRRNGMNMSQALAKKLEGQGALPAETSSRPRGSGVIVLDVLRKHPGGLSGPQIKKLVAEVPDSPRSLREHGQYIYNILAPMVGSGEVVKVDGLYRLANGESGTQKR
jgi:hypothetical protein